MTEADVRRMVYDIIRKEMNLETVENRDMWGDVTSVTVILNLGAEVISTTEIDMGTDLS